jgi:hypothetical protein
LSYRSKTLFWSSSPCEPKFNNEEPFPNTLASDNSGPH